MHGVVKLFRALMTKDLKFGSGIANRTQLLALIRQLGKVITGLSEVEVGQNKDKMSYELASKACSSKVTSELKRPEEKATKQILELMRHIEIAFIHHDTKPGDRIFSGWFLAFFFRMWKVFVKADIQMTAQDNSTAALKVTMQKNFVSSNLYACIEINGHSMVRFHNYCRDMQKPELFLPSLLNSQANESAFRTLRSMSSTRSTIVNFDVYEVLFRSNRLNVAEQAPTTIQNFCFKKKKPKNFYVPNELLSDEELNDTVKSGFDLAKKVLKDFRELDFYNI